MAITVGTAQVANNTSGATLERTYARTADQNCLIAAYGGYESSDTFDSAVERDDTGSASWDDAFTERDRADNVGGGDQVAAIGTLDTEDAEWPTDTSSYNYRMLTTAGSQKHLHIVGIEGAKVDSPGGVDIAANADDVGSAESSPLTLTGGVTVSSGDIVFGFCVWFNATNSSSYNGGTGTELTAVNAGGADSAFWYEDGNSTVNMATGGSADFGIVAVAITPETAPAGGGPVAGSLSLMGMGI
jgi:hypothetical protein